METLEKIQKKHSAILKTLNQVESILQPHYVPVGKKFDVWLDDGAIEEVAKHSEFISDNFCTVKVENKNFKPGPDVKVISIEGENIGISFAPEKIYDVKTGLEKRFKEVETFTRKNEKIRQSEPAKNDTSGLNNEIKELTQTISQKENQARYLYGKKRGLAWGRRTAADEKRERELQALNNNLNGLLNKRGSLLINNSNKLHIDSNNTYLCQNNAEDMLTLQIKKVAFDLIKAGTKKTDWRAPSIYNKKRLLAIDENGLYTVNTSIKEVKFINGRKPDAPALIAEVVEIRPYKFTREVHIPEDDFKGHTDQCAIAIKLGKIKQVFN